MRANGITLLTVRDTAAEVLGKSEMFYFSPMHPPLTESAQRALDSAVNEKLKSGYLTNFVQNTNFHCLYTLILVEKILKCLPVLSSTGILLCRMFLLIVMGGLDNEYIISSLEN